MWNCTFLFHIFKLLSTDSQFLVKIFYETTYFEYNNWTEIAPEGKINEH